MKVVVGLLLLVIAVYYSLERFDVVVSIFERGIFDSEIDELILPLVLLILSGALIFGEFSRKSRRSRNEEKDSH